MNDYATQLKLAFQLRKDKKTSEALVIYEGIWQHSPQVFGEWDGWSFGQSLKEQRKYADALEICRQLYPRFKASEMIAGQYAWCIYYTQLAGDKQPTNKADFIKVLNAIVLLSPPEKPFSPSVKSIFKLVKFLAAGQQVDWIEIGNWLLKLDKQMLSTTTYLVDVPGRRSVELASELEEWYSWQSKWLLQTKQWQKCVDLCTEALTTLKKWHYSNDSWFARRKAACYTQLGQKTEALEILQKLVNRKRDWFILADLAALTTEVDKALALYAEAALAYGEPDKKIGLFLKMNALFATKNDMEMAQDHALLIRALRIHNKWPIPLEIDQLIKANGEMPDPAPTAVMLLKKLKPNWQKLISDGEVKTTAVNAERLSGKIDYLIGAGEAGFIKPEVGTSQIYFLFRNYKGNRADIKPGLQVTYEANKSFDNKKNRVSEIAVRIKKKI